MKILIAIFLAFAVLCSCSDNGHADPVLDRADTLMYAAPDSAVAMLDSLSGLRLSADRRARLALLLAKAHEKAGTVAADSASLAAITAAADYYRGRGDSLDVQSQFYRGVLLGYRREWTAALLSLMEAADRASALGDNFYLAMAYREQADIYGKFFAYQKKYDLADLASQYFIKAGKNEHAAWEKVSCAHSLLKMNYLDSASACLEEIRPQIDALSKKMLQREWFRIYGLAKYSVLDYAEAARAMMSLDSLNVGLSTFDCFIFGASLLELDDMDQAKSYLNRMEVNRSSLSDTLVTLRLSALINEASGDFKSALRQWKEHYALSLQPKNRLLTHHYSVELNDNYRDVIGRQSEKIDETNHKLIVASLIAVALIAVLGVVVMFFRNRMLKKDIDRNLLLVEIGNLQAQLTRNIASPLTDHCRGGVEHGHPLVLLNSICEMRSSMLSGDDGARRFGKNISDFITELNSDENLKELEAFIDATADNLMSRFREQVPKITDREYSVVTFVFLGFSNASIAAIMQYKSTVNVRQIRHVIKSKICGQDSSDRERFLSYF